MRKTVMRLKAFVGLFTAPFILLWVERETLKQVYQLLWIALKKAPVE